MPGIQWKITRHAESQENLTYNGEENSTCWNQPRMDTKLDSAEKDSKNYSNYDIG